MQSEFSGLARESRLACGDRPAFQRVQGYETAFNTARLVMLIQFVRPTGLQPLGARKMHTLNRIGLIDSDYF